MKKCPYCAEEIQDEAIFCKHCQQWLNKKPSESPVTVDLPTCVPIEKPPKTKSPWVLALVVYIILYGTLLLVIFISGGLTPDNYVWGLLPGVISIFLLYKLLQAITSWHWFLKFAVALFLAVLLNNLIGFGATFIPSFITGFANSYNASRASNTAVASNQSESTNLGKLSVEGQGRAVLSEPTPSAPVMEVIEPKNCFIRIGQSPDGLFWHILNGWVLKTDSEMDQAAKAELATANASPTQEPDPTEPAQTTKIQMPDFASLSASSDQKDSPYLADWAKAVAGHARNLSIREPYQWEFYGAERSTRYQSVEDYYRKILVGMGFQLTFHEQGMGEIYLLKFKRDSQIVTIQFWGAESQKDPAFMIIYQGWE